MDIMTGVMGRVSAFPIVRETAMNESSGGKTPRIDRRALLKAAAAGGLSAPLAGAAAAESLIARENTLSGTSDGQLTYTRLDAGNRHRGRLIEGYCSKTSLRPGESIEFFLSAFPATDVVIDLYRMGWYGGKGGRHVARLGPLAVAPQPEPKVGPNRLRECHWQSAATLTIPDEWTSGVYLGKLSCRAHRYQSYVVFVIRDDRAADLLFQCSDNTWQAYNKWPGEYSLYDSDPPVHSLNGTTRVSFDRPYGKYPQVVDQPLSLGSGEFLCWEYPLCYWLEREGYDVTYCSNIDTHADPKGLLRAKVLLSVGHDEYWSLEMYENVQAAIQGGVSVAFLSGNTCCFVAPLVPSSDGRPHRVFHRAGRYGGLLEAEKPIMGPFDLEGPNENRLIGARTVNPFNGSGDWVVTNPGHWLFEGTGLRAGDRIPGLVGWEFHGDPAAIEGLEVVASGTTINGADRSAVYTATVYPGPKGNHVFNASTIFWSLGLANPPGVVPPHSHYGRPHGPDERVAAITRNLLARCGALPATHSA
jgi:hypothetical protein